MKEERKLRPRTAPSVYALIRKRSRDLVVLLYDFDYDDLRTNKSKINCTQITLVVLPSRPLSFLFF